MKPPSEKMPFVYRASVLLLRCVALLWFRLGLRGREHIPREGTCLLVANHVSYLDPPLLGIGVYPRVVHFMARDSLFKSDLAAWFLRRVCVLPIHRGQGDIGALRKGVSLLRDGRMLALFPEGTRSPDGRLLPPKGGVGFLVAKARAPVVPAFIQGTLRALPRSAFWIRPRKVRIVFGKPISPSEIEALGRGREAYEGIAALVMERIAALDPARAVGTGLKEGKV